jgi:hypothetical protein
MHGDNSSFDGITCRQEKLRMDNVDYYTKRLLLLRQQPILVVLLLVPYI